MTVYIEYVFLQNALLDGVILYVSLLATRQTFRKRDIFLSACLGGMFAVLYPLLILPVGVAEVLKWTFGALLCLLAVKRIKTKTDKKKYLLTCGLFYLCTFFIGGGVLAVLPGESNVVIISLAALGFALALRMVIQKLYQKKQIHNFIYPCTLYQKGKSVQTAGFLDSGNTAQKNGLSVCFVAPDIFYELFKERIFEDRGQVQDEIRIKSLTGVQ